MPKRQNVQKVQFFTEESVFLFHGRYHPVLRSSKSPNVLDRFKASFTVLSVTPKDMTVMGCSRSRTKTLTPLYKRQKVKTYKKDVKLSNCTRG